MFSNKNLIGGMDMLRRYGDFRNVFLGRLISNAGDSVYLIVLSWYMLEVTKSSVYVGILNFLLFLPNTFSFLFGHYFDRYSQKKWLIYLELVQALAVLVIIMGMLFKGSFIAIWVILVAAFVAATAGLNTYTVQDTLIPKIVSSKDLAKAEMYMATAYNGTDYIFSALTGFLLNIFASVYLLIADLFSFIMAIFCFKKIRFNEVVADEEQVDFFKGFKFLVENKLLLLVCVGSAILNFLFGGLNIYELLLAKELGGAGYYGVLMAIGSLGILIGTTVVANKVTNKYRLGLVFGVTTFLYGVGVCLLPFLINRYVFLIGWFLVFIFLGLSQVVQKPILQNEIPAANLGAVFSAFYTLTVSTLAIGSIFFGIVAKYLSWQLFLPIFGIAYALVGGSYLLNKKLRGYEVNWYYV